MGLQASKCGHRPAQVPRVQEETRPRGRTLRQHVTVQCTSPSSVSQRVIAGSDLPSDNLHRRPSSSCLTARSLGALSSSTVSISMRICKLKRLARTAAIAYGLCSPTRPRGENSNCDLCDGLVVAVHVIREPWQQGVSRAGNLALLKSVKEGRSPAKRRCGFPSGITRANHQCATTVGKSSSGVAMNHECRQPKEHT